MPSELKCFTSSLYASLSECDYDLRRCIAPTVRSIRCRWTIIETEEAEAAELRRQVENLPVGHARDDVLADWIVLRCCSQQHRHKLEADETGCLERLVWNYGSEMLVKEETCSELKQSCSPLESGAGPGSEIKSEMTVAITAPALLLQSTASRMTLRSGTITNQLNETSWRYGKIPDFFVHYKSDPRETVKSELFRTVAGFTARGEIYSFKWPPHPGFIKIGYTGYTAEERVEQWRVCHAGAILSSSHYTKWPERIEALVHLQLAQYRHRISICKVCYRSHEEWFKRSENEVSEVMRQWVSLNERDPLYGLDQRLTTKWTMRISALEGDITAGALISVLDAEATEAAAAAVVLETQERTAQEGDQKDQEGESKRNSLFNFKAGECSMELGGIPEQRREQELRETNKERQSLFVFTAAPNSMTQDTKPEQREEQEKQENLSKVEPMFVFGAAKTRTTLEAHLKPSIVGVKQEATPELTRLYPFSVHARADVAEAKAEQDMATHKTHEVSVFRGGALIRRASAETKHGAELIPQQSEIKSSGAFVFATSTTTTTDPKLEHGLGVTFQRSSSPTRSMFVFGSSDMAPAAGTVANPKTFWEQKADSLDFRKSENNVNEMSVLTPLLDLKITLENTLNRTSKKTELINSLPKEPNGENSKASTITTIKRSTEILSTNNVLDRLKVELQSDAISPCQDADISQSDRTLDFFEDFMLLLAKMNSLTAAKISSNAHAQSEVEGSGKMLAESGSSSLLDSPLMLMPQIATAC